nr:hypothetical protein [Tanacetum cinerariifolium]
MAQGHTQEEGIDYDEVFAPVARIEAIRLFSAYASFMGFTDPEYPARVYKVEKAMYGLHQAPRACPMEGGWHFSLSRQGKDGIGKDVDLHLYRSMIGSLTYLTASRPDIMFAVCACARLSMPCETLSKEISTSILRLLQFCDYHNMVVILEKSEHNADFHPIVDFIEASPLRIVPIFDSMLIQHGEGSGTPTEPHHTPFQEAQPSSPTYISTSSIPTVIPISTVIPIPTITQSELPPLRQYTRRARIAQSFTLPPVADEPASLMRDVSEGEACPTDSGFIAYQDRATIAKSSTLPHDTAPPVTSPTAVEGSMQQTINELTALCTSLQRQHSELLVQFQAQKVEINKLNARVKILEDNQGVIGARSVDDAPIKGRRIDEEEGITGRVSSDTEEIRMDEGEVAVERTSEDTEEMATVLTSMDAATVLAGGIDIPTVVIPFPLLVPLLLTFTLAVMLLPLPLSLLLPLIQEEREKKLWWSLTLQRNRDFIEASLLMHALTFKPTIYVSHIRQFWSTARIETTDGGTQILATVDGVLRTVTESSLRRNLKLQDEEGISSLPDTELFENLTLMGYNISPNQKFTFQKGQFSHQWKFIIHTIMHCLSPKSTGFNEFSSNIATALVCLATNRTYNFSKMIFNGLVKNIHNKVSKFLMYPRFLTMCLRKAQFFQITHTQKYVVPFHTKKLFTTLRVNSPSFSGRIVPLFDSMLIQQGEGSGTPTEPHHTPSQEAQPSSPTHISTSSIPTIIPIPTVTQSEPTPLSKGEACPTDSGFIADQDRATIAKSSTLPYDIAQRVTSPAAVEGSMQQTINELTALCTSLQRQHSELLVQFQAQKVEINKLNARVKILEDNQGVIGARSIDDAPIKGRRIDEEEGITRRVSSDTEEIRMDEGEVAFERTSEDTKEMAIVLTSMDAATVLAGGIDVPTGSDFIPTAGPPVVDIHTGSDVVPTASLIVATATVVTPYSRKKGKEVMVESDTPKKQSLDRTNETIAKYMQEYQDFASELPLERRIELIIWKLVEDFIPIGSKEEAERLKRKGFNLEQEKAKKQKTSEEVPDKEKSPEEIPKEKVKEMM